MTVGTIVLGLLLIAAVACGARWLIHYRAASRGGYWCSAGTGRFNTRLPSEYTLLTRLSFNADRLVVFTIGDISWGSASGISVKRSKVRAVHFAELERPSSGVGSSVPAEVVGAVVLSAGSRLPDYFLVSHADAEGLMATMRGQGWRVVQHDELVPAPKGVTSDWFDDRPTDS